MKSLDQANPKPVQNLPNNSSKYSLILSHTIVKIGIIFIIVIVINLHIMERGYCDVRNFNLNLSDS